MFTSTDKNLLIAAMESAIYHACVTAKIVSLHAIETGVSSLRQRFDVDPASVSDAEVFDMVDTIERATIPKLTQISGLDNTTNIADRVVSFLWKNILEKPTTFPPSAHAHPWNEISSKPTTFPPSAHTHDAQAVAWADVSDKPTTFPPSAHTHDAQAVAWNDVSDKPTTFPPAEHTHADYALTTHTHPEYTGGGGAASASTASAWALWCPPRWTLAYTLPPEIWSSPRLRVLVDGIVKATDEGGTIIYIHDDVAAIAASLMTNADNQLCAYMSPVSVYASNTARKITTILEITPTAMTVTVNGVSSTGTITRTETAQTALHITFPGWETITRVGVWTGDPATTAPLILADAEHIENNVLINQAARHIGTGQYDLTLDAPVVLYH